MSSKSDRINSFDELDPSQFAEPSEKAAELADELSRQRSAQAATGLESAVGTDGRRVPNFGEIAMQLTDVHRDMQKARNAIPELEVRGQAEVAQHTQEYLDRLRTEREEIIEALEKRTTSLEDPVLIQSERADEPKENLVSPEVSARDGSYYLAGRPLNEVKTALRGLKGWQGVVNRVSRHYRDALDGNVTSEDLLTELARQVQSGMRPVDKDIWSEYYDRYSPDGRVKEPARKTEGSKLQPKKDESSERVGRHFDADDRDPDAEWLRHQRPDEAGLARRDHKRRLKFAQAQSLPSQSVSSYSIDDSSQQGKNNMTSPEHRSDDEARAADSGNELSEELRELIPESSAPRSPLDESRSTGERPHTYSEGVQDFIRRQRAEASGEGRVAAADTTPERMRSASETDAVESRMTAEFGGQAFERGDKVLYESDSGNLAEYYILCNSIADPPGLVVQSVENEALVFAISADTEAHRVRRIHEIEDPPEGSPGPPEESPGSGGPPEGPPEGGVEEGPSDVEGSVEVPPHIIESIPRVPSQALILEAGASLRNPVDAAIQAVARAKEQREKLFGRAAPRVERLNQSRGNLETAYANYMSGWANLLAEYSSVGSSIEESKNGFQSEIGIRQEEITRLQESDLPEDVKTLQIREQQIQIDIHQAAIQECDNRLQELRETRERVLAQVEAQMMYEMAETRLDIESAQAEQNAGSLVGRFKNMWRRHPVARMAIGAGLAATGFLVGGPIGSAAMVAGVGMRGFGGYVGTEGGVNKFRDWRAGKTSSREAEAAESRTSLAARAQGERHVGNALIEGVRGDRLTAQNEFMQRHAQELYGEQMLRQVLNGDSAAAGEVATMLLQDQMDRTVEDSRWKRGAKLGGAAVGTALAALGLLRHFDADKPGPPKTPTEPRPPSSPPEGYDPRIPRMAGIHEMDPNTPENWQNIHEYAATNPAAAAAEAADIAALDRVYEAASAGMPRPQLDQLNRIIGIGAKTVGNEQMAKIIEPLASNVRGGMPTEKILELYGLPKPPVS